MVVVMIKLQQLNHISCICRGPRLTHSAIVRPRRDRKKALMVGQVNLKANIMNFVSGIKIYFHNKQPKQKSNPYNALITIL
jgi:hypothetical protein